MDRRFRLAAASAIAVLWMIGLGFIRPVLSLPDISALDRIISGDSEIPVRDLAGNLIYTYHSPTYGEQEKVDLNGISDELIALTISTEDNRFFSNPGFSPAAILRAFIQNLILRRTFSGASTITQQVVRNILLSPEERFERSIGRKVKEILLAALMTQRYDKETILTVYLNEMYYGQNATGVEKAAQVYFGKHASEIGLSEAAFIAGLPQAPNYYGYNKNAGQNRQREVLRMLERAIREDRCIQISSGKDPKTFCPSHEEIRGSFPPPLTEEDRNDQPGIP